MLKITVADTSCLILLNKIGQLELLKKLFDQLTITQTVADEFNKPLPEWINVVAFNSEEIKGLASFLDFGEATSIALASTKENSLLIIDESKGRKVAREMGIQITGSLGILVAAKQKGFIKAVKPVINKIEQTNFRISESLIRVVIEKVNES